MANNEYCPIIHMGLGLAVTERLNNMFGVSPDLVVAILRDVYSRDNTMNISADTKLTLDDLFESKAMKDVLSDRFGYGESTFVVDTKEELDSFTEAYNQLQKKGYIDANGVVTEGGIKEQESIYNVFIAGVEDDYMLWDRIKRWEDNAGNLHMVVPRPTLSPDATSEQDNTPINIYYGNNENANLSNFAYRPFTIGDQKFNSVEQYFQYKKAEFAGDFSSMQAILNAKQASVARSLGRKVRGLNVDGWDKISESVMKEGLFASFAQNENALEALLATGNRELTHTQAGSPWNEAFPRLLMEVRKELRMFDENGEFNKEYDNAKKIEVEKLVREELQGIADFLGKSVDEIRHNKQIMDEVYEKALSKREQRQQQRQTVKENEKPMTAFKNKFADRNMLNFLAETAARRISNTVSRLQDDPEFARQVFGNFLTTVDFSQLTRKEILLNDEMYDVIVSYARFYDFSKKTGWTDADGVQHDNDPYLDDILEMIYNGETKGVKNFRLLLQCGKGFLKRNEDLILGDNNTRRAITDDGQAESDSEEQDQISNEEGEGKEASQNEDYGKLAEPSVPASRKITERIKIMLSNIPDIKTYVEDGSVYQSAASDPWGFGMPVYIDPGRATNTILNILTGADSIEEMEERLRDNITAFPWLEYVVDRISISEGTYSIDKEKIRNEFFASFRKDKTVFSGIRTIENPDGTITYLYVEKNRGSKGRKNKANLKSNFETRTGIPLFKNEQIDYSGPVENSIFWNTFIEFFPDNSGSYGKSLSTLKQLYEDNPDAIYAPLDKAMTNRNSILGKVYSALEYFGIDCDPNAFYAMAMSDKASTVDKFEDTNIGKIISDLNTIAVQLNRFNPANQYKIPYYNPMNFNLEVAPQDRVYIAKEYSNIIDIIGAFTESDTESVAHVNGKAHYAFNYPTFMQTTISKLSSQFGSRPRLREFFQKRYDNDWYSYIDDKGKRHYYLDILEKISQGRNEGHLEYIQQLDINGVDYKDMSPRSYAMSILANYFMQVDQNTALYRAPIASDKPAMDNIRWTRLSDHSDTENNYKVQVTNQAWNIALQEINRSRRVLDRALHGSPRVANFDIKFKDAAFKAQHQKIVEKIRNGEDVKYEDLFVNDKYIYAKSGVGFKFVRVLQEVLTDNTLIAEYELKQARQNLRQAIVDTIFNGKDSIKDQSVNFSVMFNAFMQNRVIENINYLTDIGVLDKKFIQDEDGSRYGYYPHMDSMVRKYARENGIDPQMTNETFDLVMQEMLTEFAYNNFIMQIQMAQLFGVDLAFYKGTTDFQKRSAQTRSTGQKLNKGATLFGKKILNSDGKLRTITLKTSKHVSYAVKDIESVLRNYASTIKNEQERIVFENSIPNILKMYEEVDPTDGQAWNSLSGLRLKHHLAAKWTYAKDDDKIGTRVDGELYWGENSHTDEAVYRRFINKHPLPSDFFHVFTQVDKPFVYDVSVRDGIPVPVQQKNAEYTYVLLNQYTSYFKNDSPVTVLISAMERTFRKSEEFNDVGTGIATANFDSAVKVGTTEGIDIDLPVDVLKEKLNRLLHLDEDGPNRYESGVITAIDADSYSYQQNNPEHFINHRQLLGSQEKILSFANTRDEDEIEVGDEYTALKSIMPEGANIIVGKALKETYFDVLKQRAFISDEMLRNDLGLDQSEKAKMEKIADKLQDSIALGKRYSSDDLMAVTLYGRNFLLAAEDATQAANIKAITASWVRKALYRQEILGGPIVQATGFGRSKKLKTIIEDGRLKHFQTIVPMPEQIAMLLRDNTGNISSRFFDYKTGEYKFYEIKKYLHDLGADGMLKVLLYRIPTEGKYSVFPCEIVGFANANGGSTVLLPDDGTTIAGFDFDTDKLFALLKEYATRDGKPLFKDVEDENGNIVKNVIEYTPTAKSRYGQMAGYNNVLFDMQYLSLTTLQSAAEIFDPGNFEDLTELSFKIELMRSFDESGHHLYTRQEIDNMTPRELSDAWDELNDLDITDLKTMVMLHNQNMSSKDMLGIAAVSNISHAQLSMFTQAHPIYQVLPSRSTIHLSWTDRLGNSRSLSLHEKVAMDQLRDVNGELISKYLRKYVGAAADAAKNPTLFRLGTDKATFPVIQWMLRAGIPMELAHKFISLPVFRVLSSAYQMLNDGQFTSVDAAINYVESRIFWDQKNRENSDEYRDAHLFDAYSSPIQYRDATFKQNGFWKSMDLVLNEAQLDELIYKDPREISATSHIYHLEMFRMFSELAGSLSVLSDYGRINSAVAGPKASIEENDARAAKFDRVKELFSGKSPKFVGITYEQLQELMPYETQMHNSVRELLDAIQGDLFPSYTSATYYSGMSVIENITKKPMTTEQKKRFNEAQKMMALSISGYDLGLPDFYQLYDNETAIHYYRDFADWYVKELRELKDANEDLQYDLDENILLKEIGEPVNPTISCPIKLLNTSIFGADETFKYRVSQAWLDLITYRNDELPKDIEERVHNLGLELFRYFTLRNGGKDFDAKTPWHLAPLDLKTMIPGYNDRLKDIASFTVNSTNLAIQFLLNNARSPEYLPQFNPALLGISPDKMKGTVTIESMDQAMMLLNQNPNMFFDSELGLGIRPMAYIGNNAVIIFGNIDDIKAGEADFIPVTTKDETTGEDKVTGFKPITYRIVPAMGIQGVISEYYPMIRNSVYNIINEDTGGFMDDITQDIRALEDLEDRRVDSSSQTQDVNLNNILLEVAAEFGYKFNDLFEANTSNYSLSRVRLRNMLRLTNAALLQKLGFKRSALSEDEATRQALLDRARKAIENIC